MSMEQMEALEVALIGAQSSLAKEQVKAAAALEGEAVAREEQLAAEEKSARAAIDSKRQLASLERDVAMLTRLREEGGGKATIDASVASLSANAARREVLAQRAALNELAEALTAAEARVRELERLANLARVAQLMDTT